MDICDRLAKLHDMVFLDLKIVVLANSADSGELQHVAVFLSCIQCLLMYVIFVF